MAHGVGRALGGGLGLLQHLMVDQRSNLNAGRIRAVEFEEWSNLRTAVDFWTSGKFDQLLNLKIGGFDQRSNLNI